MVAKGKESNQRLRVLVGSSLMLYIFTLPPLLGACRCCSYQTPFMAPTANHLFLSPSPLTKCFLLIMRMMKIMLYIKM